MIEAENSLGGKGGVMWRGEKNSKWKDGRLNFVFTGENTACEQTKGWQDAPPLFSDWRLDSSPSSWWQPLPLTPSVAAVVSVQYQLLKQLLYCQRVDIALSQQPKVEDYLSQCMEACWGEGYGMKGRRGGEQKEWMNHFKNGNLMTDKLLINLADTASVCVYVHVWLCGLFVPCLWENTTLVTAKADYEIKWYASGK